MSAKLWYTWPIFLLILSRCAQPGVKLQVKLPDATELQSYDVDLFVYMPKDAQVDCDAIGFGDREISELESQRVYYRRLVQHGKVQKIENDEQPLPRQARKLALALVGQARGAKTLQPSDAVYADCKEFTDLVDDGPLMLEPQPTLALKYPDLQHNSLVAVVDSQEQGNISVQSWQQTSIEPVSAQGLSIAAADQNLTPGPSRLRLRVLDADGQLFQKSSVTMNGETLIQLPAPGIGPFQIAVQAYFQRGQTHMLPGFAWQTLVDSEAEQELNSFLTSTQYPILWMRQRQSGLVNSRSAPGLVFARSEQQDYFVLCHIGDLSQARSDVHCASQQVSTRAIPLGSMQVYGSREHFAEALWLPPYSLDNTGLSYVQLVPDEGGVVNVAISDTNLHAAGSLLKIGSCGESSPATYLMALENSQDILKYQYMRIDFSPEENGEFGHFTKRLYSEQESKELFPNAVPGELSGRQCLRDTHGQWQGLLGLRSHSMPFSSVFHFDGTASVPAMNQPLPAFDLIGFVPHRHGSHWAVWSTDAQVDAPGDALLSIDDDGSGYKVYAFDLIGDADLHLSSGRLLQAWNFSQDEQLESVNIAVAQKNMGQAALLATQFVARRATGEREATILLSSGGGPEDIPHSLGLDLLSQGDSEALVDPPELLFGFVSGAASDSSLHLMVAQKNALSALRWRVIKMSQ